MVYKLMKLAPLSSGFMLGSIIGFIVSVFYISSLDATWGFTFTIFFVLMFVASMISMTYAPLPEDPKA